MTSNGSTTNQVQKVTAEHLLSLLERDLIRKQEAPSGVFMREVGSPDGRRRADALFIKGVGGQGIDGYEIKVSRSDLINEIADPHKVDSWKKYCRRWWLVVSDPKMLEGLDIPDDWGIKVPPTAKNRIGFTVVRDAPILEPVPLGPVIGRLSTMWAYRMRDLRMERKNAEGIAERDRKARQAAEDKLKAHGLSNHPEPETQKTAMTLIAGLRKRGIWSRLPGEGDPERIEALLDALADVLAGESIKNKAKAALDTKIRQINTMLQEVDKSWELQSLRRELDNGLML